jgi:hypothetical protein
MTGIYCCPVYIDTPTAAQWDRRNSNRDRRQQRRSAPARGLEKTRTGALPYRGSHDPADDSTSDIL